MELLGKKDYDEKTQKAANIHEARAAFERLNQEGRAQLLSIKDNSGRALIHSAAFLCVNPDIVRALFALFDVEQIIILLSTEDGSGWTPVHWAFAFCKNAAVVQA